MGILCLASRDIDEHASQKAFSTVWWTWWPKQQKDAPNQVSSDLAIPAGSFCLQWIAQIRKIGHLMYVLKSRDVLFFFWGGGSIPSYRCKPGRIPPPLYVNGDFWSVFYRKDLNMWYEYERILTLQMVINDVWQEGLTSLIAGSFVRVWSAVDLS